jgi:hypothetical protein
MGECMLYRENEIIVNELKGGEKMDWEKILGWSSPIGVAIFFVGSGILLYLGVLALITLRGY